MSGLGSFFAPLRISASGMQAERTRMDVAASNLANARATRTPEGGPYRRRRVFFETVLNNALTTGTDKADGFNGLGVRVSEISMDMDTPFPTILDPSHPDADENGMVRYPNVQTEFEMVDLMDASRAYEANAAAFRLTREMLQRAVDLGRA